MVAIKSITKKNLAKSQNLLGKEIKILKVGLEILRVLKETVVFVIWKFEYLLFVHVVTSNLN